METGYNTTIPDTSPQVSYHPYAEGDPSTGWDSYYEGTGFISSTNETGNGTSSHVTRFASAELDIRFYGTGVWLYGSVINTGYVTLLDDVISKGTQQGDGVLAAYTGLQPGWHQVALIANCTTPESYLSFESAVVSSGTGVTGAEVSNSSYGCQNPAIGYAGQWEVTTNATSSGQTSNFQQTSRFGDTATLNFIGPAISIYGARGPAYGHYYVRIKDDYLDKTLTFDGESQWDIPDALLFWEAGLSTNCSHQVIITNADDTKMLAVSSFMATEVVGGQALGSSSSSSTPTPTPPATDQASPAGNGLPMGTIIAIALSITVAIVASFLCLLRHRQRTRRLATAFLPPSEAPRAKASFSRLKPFLLMRRPMKKQNNMAQTYDHGSRLPVSSADLARMPLSPAARRVSDDLAALPEVSTGRREPPSAAFASSYDKPQPAIPVDSTTVDAPLAKRPGGPRSPSSTHRNSVMRSPRAAGGAHYRSVSQALSDSSPDSSMSSGRPAPSQHYQLARVARDAQSPRRGVHADAQQLSSLLQKSDR